jgi:hypothetical protein
MLYEDNDIDTLKQNIENIINEAEKFKTENLKLAMTSKEKAEVQKVILDYLKENHRKIYGGFALNMFMMSEHPDDVFYKGEKLQTADIDFYSPDPINDLIKICNVLFKQGYRMVSTTEGFHEETYKLFVDGVNIADSTYVPNNIYKKMPFNEINGFFVTSPSFMMIDYLRMFSDPILSYWRMTDDLKAFRRFRLIEKHYPIRIVDKRLELNKPSDTGEIALTDTFNFICDHPSCIALGFYAYNCYLSESDIMKLSNPKSKKYRLLKVPYYEILSTNYIEDAQELVKKLKSNIVLRDVNYIEFYPFFQFTGFSVEIYVGDELIAVMYHNNKKCYPYREIKGAMNYNKNEQTTKTIKISTFTTTLLYGLINLIIGRTNGMKDVVNLYNIFNSHLVEMRKYYFDKNKKTFLDDTLFKDFTVPCIGHTLTALQEKQRKINDRKKKGKRLTFSYYPDQELQEFENTWIFPNSSGNQIHNPKNFKLTGSLIETDSVDEEEEKEDKNEKKE